MLIPPGLVTALRTLTIIPVSGDESDNRADALSWFPVAGALIGLVLWLVSMLGGGVKLPFLMSAVVLAVGTLLTRSLHLDGLADWADAFWGGWTPERRLEIMKDSSLGTHGTLALILVLLAKWSAVAVLLEHSAQVWIILACIISRTAQVDAAVNFPYARPEGGTGADFVNRAADCHREHAFLIAFFFTIVLGVLTLRPLFISIATLIVGRFFCRSCMRSFGGVTGDTLGAVSELTETMLLMLAAVSAG